jgi:RNA-directed DNA polymerase
MAEPCCAWTAATKRNASGQSTHRTSCWKRASSTRHRERVSLALDRVRQAARLKPKEKLTSLFHHLSLDLLQETIIALKRDAAPGADGVTWRSYAADLERNLTDLHARPHREAYRAQPSRRTWIPKADGKRRPLAVAALEDKIVQRRSSSGSAQPAPAK